MPRSLHEYRLSDWCRLRPVTHSVKTWRYRRTDDLFLNRKPTQDGIVAVRSAIARRPTLITIAFNDWQLIQWQTAIVAQCIPHAVHLVVDNSSCNEAAARIEAMCQRNGTLRLRLPSNPWTHRNPSRSHGLAMNWTWRHVILPAQPTTFGFIDHDLFPLEPCDPFEPLTQLACWGDKRWAGSRWFLWAGFCFFRFEAVRHLSLDFGLDWFAGLDTGGANWEVLYRHLNPQTLPDRLIERRTAIDGVSTEEEYFEQRGTWVHEVGLAGRRDLREKKREAFQNLLASHCPHQLIQATQ